MPDPVASLIPVARALADEKLSDEWRALADAARTPNPFHGPEIVGAAAQHLPGAESAQLLCVQSDDQLDLVLPVLPQQRIARAPWRATTVLDHGQSMLGTPLVRTHSVDLWRDALRGLAERSPDCWSVLPTVDAEAAESIVRAAQQNGRVARTLGQRGRAFTHRRPEGDYLASQISSRSRKSLRRNRRRLAEDLGGDLEVVDLLERDGVDVALTAFIDLEKAGWKGDVGGAIGNDPAETRFFRDACRSLARRGKLEIYGLEGRDGTLAAAAVDFVDGPGWFTVKTTYNEDHGDRSPGSLLDAVAFERFHDRGLDFMDSCASPNNQAQHRIFGEERELTHVVVSLRGRRGDVAAWLSFLVLKLQLVSRDARRWWRREGRSEAVRRLRRAHASVSSLARRGADDRER